MKTQNSIFNSTFTKSELVDFKNCIENNKSLYQSFKEKIQKFPKLKEFFNKNSSKNIALELFGEDWLKANPLYNERKKTSICLVFDNLKRLCKDPKEKGNGKKWDQIAKELDYIRENFSSYPENEQSSILHHFDKLAIILGYSKK